MFLAAHGTKQEGTDGFQCRPCALGSSGTSWGEILFHIYSKCLFGGCFQLFAWEGKCSYFKLILKKNTFNNLFFSVICDLLTNTLPLAEDRGNASVLCSPSMGAGAEQWLLWPEPAFCTPGTVRGMNKYCVVRYEMFTVAAQSLQSFVWLGVFCCSVLWQ